jgi:hypothetical protein
VSPQHRGLAAGRWKELSLIERMANIGGEVERALSWRAKNNSEYCRLAFERALELIGLSIEHFQRPSQLKELARVREALIDYFYGTNELCSSESSWRKYFSQFTYAARKDS